VCRSTFRSPTRLRHERNGTRRVTLHTVADALPRPQWWIDFLTTEPLAFATLGRWSGTVAE
jgi:L-lactate dehydrogenase (cytochrome)